MSEWGVCERVLSIDETFLQRGGASSSDCLFELPLSVADNSPGGSLGTRVLLVCTWLWRCTSGHSLNCEVIELLYRALGLLARTPLVQVGGWSRPSRQVSPESPVIPAPS